MKTVLAFILLVLTQISYSSIQLEETTLQGEMGVENEKVFLCLKRAPGRIGSFLGLFVKKDFTSASLFLIDPINSNSFSLTNFNITHDGEIGIKNEEPKFILVVENLKDNKYRIINANQSSGAEQSFISFYKTTNSFKWSHAFSGEFDFEDQDDALSISELDSFNSNSSIVITTSKLNGLFQLREKLPFMYSLNLNAATSTGIRTNEIPLKIGVFVKVDNFLFFDDDIFLLLNPDNKNDILKFTKN